MPLLVPVGGVILDGLDLPKDSNGSSVRASSIFLSKGRSVFSVLYSRGFSLSAYRDQEWFYCRWCYVTTVPRFGWSLLLDSDAESGYSREGKIGFHLQCC